MPDLPLVDKKILPLAVELEVMKRGGSLEDQKPHKLLMLLAVFDLMDQGLINGNRIYFNDQLVASFEKYFRKYAESKDLCQPGPPFFHMRNSSFWKHKIRDGRESVYSDLTTSGGGIKRIKENIEYAYFDEHIYSLISQKKYRDELITFIQTLLPMPKMNKSDRIPALFHESFPLSRPSITQILKALFSAPSDFDFSSKTKREDYFSKTTTIGNNYIKSMPNYCKGTGLLDFNYHFTTFTKSVFVKDILLDQIFSQWLMHYHLSAPTGPGPAFWHELVKTRFRAGDEFTSQDIADQIGEFFMKEEGKRLADRSARSTATVFLGTYTRSDGLANLELLEETEKDHFRVLDPEPPSTWVIAYAILHWWKSLFNDQVTINLNDLYGDRGLTQILMIGKGRLNSVLDEMQDEGFLELYRVAPPYQVVLHRRDEEAILGKIYGG